jgi:acetyl esterase
MFKDMDIMAYRDHEKRSIDSLPNFFESLPLNPLASPLLAKDLAGLPPALVIAAENDVLCNEDQTYAMRLKEAGVNVQYKFYEGCDHGFTHTGPREAAQDAWMLMATFLRNNFQYA